MLEEVTHTTLEGFLADAKRVVDIFGIGFVVERTESVGLHLEVVEKLLTEVRDALLTKVLLQFEVDFSVFTHLLHKGGHSVARVERLENLILENQSTIALVHDGFHTEVSFLLDNCLYGVTRLIRRKLLRQELLQFCRSDDAVGDAVDITINKVFLALNHAHLLFLERTEEVLHQSPIEESTKFVGPLHFEIGKFVDLHKRVFSSGDESFLTIEIEEHINDVSHFRAFGNISFWQQYIAHFSGIEIHAEIHFSQHFEAVALS